MKPARFSSPTEVLVEVSDREQFGRFWTESVRRSGLFVATTQPPALRSQLRVSVVTPDGTLELNAEVVHVLDGAQARQAGAHPGVGVQFVGITERVELLVRRYLDGDALRFGTDLEERKEQHDLEEALIRARRLLQGLDVDDPLGAAGLSADASEEKIRLRLRELAILFNRPHERLSPPNAARLAAALKALPRLSVLLDPAQRAAHQARKRGRTHTPPSTRSLDPAMRINDGAEARRRAARARRLVRNGLFAEAEAEWTQAVSLDPGLVEYQVEHAWTIANNPQLPQVDRKRAALERLEAIVARYSYPDAWAKMAMLHGSLGDMAQAEECARRAVELDRTQLAVLKGGQNDVPPADAHRLDSARSHDARHASRPAPVATPARRPSFFAWIDHLLR